MFLVGRDVLDVGVDRVVSIVCMSLHLSLREETAVVRKDSDTPHRPALTSINAHADDLTRLRGR